MPDSSSVQFYMARTRHPTRPSIRTHPARWPITGTLIVLFFQCMAALFNPAYRRMGGTRWGLVSYTVAIFSFATVRLAINLDIQSISFIDNRAFPGIEGVVPPEPLGYQSFVFSDVLSIVLDLMPVLNNLLADGLLVSALFDTAFASPDV